MDSLRQQTALRRKATFYIVGDFSLISFYRETLCLLRGWETSVFSLLKSLVGGGKILYGKCSEKLNEVQSVAKTKLLIFRKCSLVAESLLLRYKKKSIF